MTTATIEIVSPLGVSVSSSKKTGVAPRRLNNLQGARIGLLDNNKPNADKFLEFVGALLESRNASVELVPKRKMSRTGAEFIPELIARCDVVINAFAD